MLAAFIALFATINQRDVTSHNLAYTLLPFYLSAVWKYAFGWSKKILPMLVLGAVLPLIHNMALAFVGAGAFVIAVHRPHSVYPVVVASLTVATAVASCLLAGVSFGLSAGHVIGLGQGRYTTAEHFWQMTEGTGWLLAPAAHGLSFVSLISVLALDTLLARNEKASALRAGLLVVACGAAAIIVLFNFVWIFNEQLGLHRRGKGGDWRPARGACARLHESLGLAARLQIAKLRVLRLSLFSRRLLLDRVLGLRRRRQSGSVRAAPACGVLDSASGREAITLDLG